MALAESFKAGAQSAWDAALERAEGGESLDAALGLPSDFRKRKRDALLRALASAGFSPEKIAVLLRRPAGPFAETARRILLLNNGKTLKERQLRNIVN